MTFCASSEQGYVECLSGIQRKTLVSGERTLMTEFRMQRSSTIPDHAHPHEQTGYLVKGHVFVKIGDREYEATAGDSWCIPGNVLHGVRILEDSIAVEVFSPVRTDYLS